MMKPITEGILNEAATAFAIQGQFQRADPYGSGHINDTYAAYYQMEDGLKRYILQRINTDTFTKPDELMENISKVTSFVRNVIQQNGGDPERECLNLVPAKSGGTYYTDSDGGCWRVYLFVEKTTTYQQATEETFRESARSFGRFQRLLADYPADTLHETIPNFHNTADRFAKFRAAVEKDAFGRADSVQEEIAFVMAREADTHFLLDLLEAKKLPLRVTHNDTKLNNILIDDATGKGICVIDLDTVMPGLSLYDYGDSIRFGATKAAEDERDLSKVHFELPLFEAYTQGFLEVVGDVLTPCEVENLPMGAKMMTLECGIRFLTDYLSGDTYFKIHRDGQNLDRTRTQFRLVAEMEENWDAMRAIVQKYAGCAVR